jgi:uncharacterized protein YbdZ (MbtH family)
MYHSLKIKILDLDHIESIVEQDITDVEAEKIVGGTLSVSEPQVVAEKTIVRVGGEHGYELPPLVIPLPPPWRVVLISSLPDAALDYIQIAEKLKA